MVVVCSMPVIHPHLPFGSVQFAGQAAGGQTGRQARRQEGGKEGAQGSKKQGRQEGGRSSQQAGRQASRQQQHCQSRQRADLQDSFPCDFHVTYNCE